MAGHEIATSLLVLKAFAKNPDAEYVEIAKITGKPQSVVAEVVKEYASVYSVTRSRARFPYVAHKRDYRDNSGNDLSLKMNGSDCTQQNCLS